MKTKSQAKSTHTCPCCDEGELVTKKATFKTSTDGKAVTVPGVEMEICTQCGESFLTPDGSRKVDAWLDEHADTISMEELQKFLEQYQLTQKEAAQILDIGEKNFSRWLNGKQRVSASMSNYIRTLTAVPEAFETLRNKQWGGGAGFPTEKRQPDLDEKPILGETDYSQLIRIGLVQDTRKHDERRSELCRITRTADLLEFRALCKSRIIGIAAFKDTAQKYSPINGGLWVYLGERAAESINTAPYSRDKLEKAVEDLRELTRHEPHLVFNDVQKRLAAAGVALVIVPKLQGSAYRGCTRLIHPAKAIIIHSLKYKNVSQFWRVLFHEIAHLILHINTPDEMFIEYENQKTHPREKEADQWANETLVYGEKLIAFQARHPNPSMNDLVNFAKEIDTSPAIIAEIVNEEAGEEVFNYARLRKAGLFPVLEADSFASLS